MKAPRLVLLFSLLVCFSVSIGCDDGGGEVQLVPDRPPMSAEETQQMEDYEKSMAEQEAAAYN